MLEYWQKRTFILKFQIQRSKLKNTVHDLGMSRTKQTPRLSEMTTEDKKAYDKRARDHRADFHTRHLASTHRNRKTTQDGKAPHKQLVTKATQKGGAAATPTKPHHNWSILTIRESISSTVLTC